MKPIFFRNFDEMFDWLKNNHQSQKELIAGYYKRATGKESITWSDSVDAALCFGWIDGIRRSLDDTKYTIRFTPRNPKSYWSAINIKKIGELKKRGLLQPEGLSVFERRSPEKSEVYSFEKSRIVLDKKYLSILKKNKAAWKFFENSAPYYKKTVTHWIMSAKREETRLKRLHILISSSEENEKIPAFRP